MNDRKHAALAIGWALLLAGLAATVMLTGESLMAATATRYVAPGGDCGGASPCYRTIQGALDAASTGDTIKVAAGVYAGIQKRTAPPGYNGPAFIRQLAYIDKPVSILGGYSVPGYADPPSPRDNPTILNANGQGRVLFINGDIWSDPIDVTVEGLHLTGGNATGQGGSPGTSPNAGGGLYAWRAAVAIRNCDVYSNTASTAGRGYGGGLFLAYGSAYASGNRVWGNVASSAGNGTGGGVYVYKGDATLNGNDVHGNIAQATANGGQDGHGQGGGLSLEYSTATLTGNRVARNTASAAWHGYGGGLALYESTATLAGNQIVDNTASEARYGEGGGLHAHKSHVVMLANAVADNTASVSYDGGGGGLNFEESHVTLERNTIEGNLSSVAADGYGGGVAVYWESSGTLEGNTIVSNTATLNPAASGGGGGIALGCSSPVELTNNLVAGNHANTIGSGLVIGGASWCDTLSRLFHTTIAGNLGSGQGVHVGINTSVALTNTMIVGHHTAGITVTLGGTASLEATLWDGNAADTAGDGEIRTGTNNWWGDPGFQDSRFRIGAGSAALDRGVHTAVRSDIDGQPRPYRVPDLGADEYWPPGILQHSYLPLVLAGPDSRVAGLTPTPTATVTPTPSPTNTPVPPGSTATFTPTPVTPVPTDATPTPSSTNTPVPPGSP